MTERRLVSSVGGLSGLAVVLLLGVISLAQVVAVNPDPHEENCMNCHLGGDKVTTDNAHQLLSSQERLCGQCHENALRLSHSSGFTPTRAINPAYPLDWKGDVTCSTCHDLHNGKPGLMRGTKSGRDFCLACHQERFFTEMPDRGASIINTAHLERPARGEPLALDSSSIQCLDCHDGKANAGPMVLVDAGGLVRHDGGMNHPIGMDYDKSAIYGGYRPRQQLTGRVYLPQGRLGCISCHKGFSQQHGELVLSNQGSRLCFECHDI